MCSHIRVLENVKESTRTNKLYDDIPNFVVNTITMVHQTVNENDDVFQQENKNDNDYIDTEGFSWTRIMARRPQVSLTGLQYLAN